MRAELGIAAVAGVAVGYILHDPAQRGGRAVGARIFRRTPPQRPPRDYNDETLAHKIESEVLGPEHISRGQVKVNVQNGVAQLRGILDTPELIGDLVRRIRTVEGVRDVESLLHVPTTDAPMHQ
jgi:osmotically-inducible protein OsmY